MTNRHQVRLFPSLRHEVDSLFNRVLEPLSRFPSPWLPQVDVREEPDRFILEMDLPGVAREDLSISLAGRELTLTGTRRLRRSLEQGVYHYEERHAGTFRRTLHLPADVDAERVSAVLREGILRLELPKKGGAR